MFTRVYKYLICGDSKGYLFCFDRIFDILPIDND